MNKSIVLAVLSAAGLAAVAQAQTVYTFEMRLIPDGAAGAPTGSWSSHAEGATATRIGFWLQARVSQTGGQNWGIGRFSAPPAPNCDFITVTDSAGGTTLQRGTVNSGTQHGRGAGFRTGGVNVGATGNSGTSAAFPGPTGNENGGIDSGGTRIYGMDAYVGSQRAGILNPDTEELQNPWAVNGGAASLTAAPVPTGQFSPWANLFRVWLVPTNSGTVRTITLNASGQLNGTQQAAETSTGSGSWAMQLGAGQTVTAQYSFSYGIPTPGAAALMGMGMLAAGRRRR
ncbi:MAG: hypothetical protein Q8L55_03640 [Phycisphaerales bacterium]|nr:hypothetical protein [Phycisphaerales bacterium]